jgi:hypothetical protein
MYHTSIFVDDRHICVHKSVSWNKSFNDDFYVLVNNVVILLSSSSLFKSEYILFLDPLCFIVTSKLVTLGIWTQHLVLVSGLDIDIWRLPI